MTIIYPVISQMLKTIAKIGCTLLAIEYNEPTIQRVRTVKINKIKNVRSTYFFYYDNNLVFEYSGNKNIRIYEVENYVEYDVEVKPKHLTNDEIHELINELKKDRVKYYNCLGTDANVYEFAKKMYFTKDTTKRLRIAVLEEAKRNSIKRYGAVGNYIEYQLAEAKKEYYGDCE